MQYPLIDFSDGSLHVDKSDSMGSWASSSSLSSTDDARHDLSPASTRDEEDLMIFTPPGSPKCHLPSARLPVVNHSGQTGLSNNLNYNKAQVVDHEARLFRDPLRQCRSSPSTSGTSSPKTPVNRINKIFVRPSSLNFVSNGCNVVVTNLPLDASSWFVLQRVRGGNVANCILTEFKDRGTDEKQRIAVVQFETAGAAEQYVSTLADDKTAHVWTWSTNAGDSESQTKASCQLTQYKYLPRATNTDLSMIPLDYPSEPPSTSPTRCLVITSCLVENLATIWADLHLPRLLLLPYYRSQIEDIWFDNLKKDELDVVVSGTLHIRFTSVRMAIDAFKRVARKPWAIMRLNRPHSPGDPLQFEPDPCALEVTTLHSPIGSHPGYEYLRKEHLPLLALQDEGKLGQMFENWSADKATGNTVDTAAPKDTSPGSPLATSTAQKDHVEAKAAAELQAISSNLRQTTSLRPSMTASVIDIRTHHNLDSFSNRNSAPEAFTTDSRAFKTHQPPVDPATDVRAAGLGSTSRISSVSMAEYLAMSEEQWMAFGTESYSPPEGFDTPEFATIKKSFLRRVKDGEPARV